jgi:hypothetical protein
VHLNFDGFSDETIHVATLLPIGPATALPHHFRV